MQSLSLVMIFSRIFVHGSPIKLRCRWPYHTHDFSYDLRGRETLFRTYLLCTISSEPKQETETFSCFKFYFGSFFKNLKEVFLKRAPSEVVFRRLAHGAGEANFGRQHPAGVSGPTVVPERRRRLQRAGTESERLSGPGPGRLGDSGVRGRGRASPGRPGVRFSERVTGLIPAGGRGPRWLNGMHGAGAAAGRQAPGARGHLTR